MLLASLILHASIAKIIAQVLSLSLCINVKCSGTINANNEPWLHFILIVHFRHSTNYKKFVTTCQLILINLELHVY